MDWLVSGPRLYQHWHCASWNYSCFSFDSLKKINLWIEMFWTQTSSNWCRIIKGNWNFLMVILIASLGNRLRVSSLHTLLPYLPNNKMSRWTDHYKPSSLCIWMNRLVVDRSYDWINQSSLRLVSRQCCRILHDHTLWKHYCYSDHRKNVITSKVLAYW